MRHITSEQRYAISCLLNQGQTKLEIAIAIGKDVTSIRREIHRNSDLRNGKYNPELAERKCKNRHKEKNKKERLTVKMKMRIEALIREDYSPEQVKGYLEDQGVECVSHETIYQHIWQDKKAGGDLHTNLRRQGRKYRKRGNQKDSRGMITNRVGIDKRPSIVEDRSRFGDLEVDLIIGSNHKSAIVTINDRASGMLKMKKVKSKQAKEVSNTINQMLEDWLPFIHTMTSDNGKEFAEHKNISEELNIDYYFANPYHSWERGSNENLNGLVRQYISKGSDFRQLSDKYIQQVQERLNNRPRKRFKYKSPIFVMNKLLFNQSSAFIT